MTSISRLEDVLSQTLQWTSCWVGTRCSPEVNRVVTDTLADTPDDLDDAEFVNVICRDELESDFLVMLEVFKALR